MEILQQNGFMPIINQLVELFGYGFLLIAVSEPLFDIVGLPKAYRRGVFFALLYVAILLALKEFFGFGKGHADGLALIAGLFVGYMTSSEADKETYRRTKEEIAKAFFSKFAIGVGLLTIGRLPEIMNMMVENFDGLK